MRLTPRWLNITLKEDGVPWELQIMAGGVLTCILSLLAMRLIYTPPNWYSAIPSQSRRWFNVYGLLGDGSNAHLTFALLRTLAIVINVVGGLGTGVSIGALVLSTIQADDASFPLFANPFMTFGPRVYMPIGPNSTAALALVSMIWIGIVALIQATAAVFDSVEGDARSTTTGCWVAAGLLCEALRRWRFFDAVPAALVVFAVQTTRRAKAQQLVPAKAAAAIRSFAEQRVIVAFRESEIRWLLRLLASPEIGLVVDGPLLEDVARYRQAALVKFLLLQRSKKNHRRSNVNLFELELERAKRSRSPNLAHVLRHLISKEKEASEEAPSSDDEGGLIGKPRNESTARRRRPTGMSLDDQYQKWDRFDGTEASNSKDEMQRVGGGTRNRDSESGSRDEFPEGEGWLEWSRESIQKIS